MSADNSTGTHPVYIGRDLKKEVKVEATQRELTMRQITERLINRGMDEGFHTEPLPQEFHDKLDDLDEEVERAHDQSDLDRLEDRLEDLETDFSVVDLPEEGAEDDIQERIDAVNDRIETARGDFE
jgi:hypothetical protein